MNYLIIFAASFGLVAIKSIQQLNVSNGHYRLVPITSYIFAAFTIIDTYYVVDGLFNEGHVLGIWLAMGTGAGIGAVAAMKLHEKVTG